jgi:outer membrane protein OmpA-like peptidoglycan-associated protein
MWAVDLFSEASQMTKRWAAVLALALATAPPAFAQTQEPEQEPPAEVSTRPATTTPYGDTGLWFVPTAEVLPRRTWSVSLFRTNFDYEQGFTDVSTWPITIGVGLADRVELFGAVQTVVRIDRDLRPVFLPASTAFGGAVNPYPFVTDGWIGNQFGDIYIGGKFNLLSEHRQQPAAFALRGMVKLPTADEAEGAGTGKPDWLFDAILSKELNERVELSGFGGLIIRNDPDEWDLASGFRWGFGAGFPTRRALRLTAELHGEAPLDDTIAFTGPQILQAIDLSVLPIESNVPSLATATLGLTWQHSNGFFVGGGLNWSIAHDGRSEGASDADDETGDSLGVQFRIGYHPGVRVYVPPPPPPPPPPANGPPTVKARCEPCTVEVGKSSTVTANAQDPDGDQLAYKWSAPTGTLQSPADRQSLWTAPMEPGPVPVTVTVDDGKGGTASDTVTIQVIRPPVKEFVFEDVHFDFDRYSLRPEATRILDEAIKALQENPELRLEIEGHTCNIGTAEYNLALGERRATAVREYLSSRGIGADRLRTVSYGEERPKHDNAREETRRLNRRAAMVVRVQR